MKLPQKNSNRKPLYRRRKQFRIRKLIIFYLAIAFGALSAMMATAYWASSDEVRFILLYFAIITFAILAFVAGIVTMKEFGKDLIIMDRELNARLFFDQLERINQVSDKNLRDDFYDDLFDSEILLFDRRRQEEDWEFYTKWAKIIKDFNEQQLKKRKELKKTQLVYAALPSEISDFDTTHFLPPEAEKIDYIVYDSEFGHVIEWQCHIGEREFLAFAERRNWRLRRESSRYRSWYFIFFPGWDFPDGGYYYESKPHRNELYILYDPERKMLYGQYSER